MKKLIIIVIIALAFFNCNRNSNNGQTIKNIETQFFEIPIGEATTITTKGGVIIEIQENTFESNASTIQLEVQEILTRADLIRSGISTITKKGELLETGGMVNITTTSHATINPEAPIKVKVPSKGLDTEMKLYEAVQKDSKIVWSLKSDLENQPYFDRIAAGKRLFIDSCSMCHNRDISKDMTGPKLGNVTSHRSREWLRDFTRNSAQMIADGDSVANCLFSAWSNANMNQFLTLTDTEIDNIYDFIENETLLRGLDTIQVIDCERLEKQRQEWKRKDSLIRNMMYEYHSIDFGIRNIDKVINETSIWTLEEVEPFEIKTNNDNIYRIFMIFEEQNICIEFYRYKDKYYLNSTFPNQKALLPLYEPIKIVAISFNLKKVDVITTTIQKKNKYRIKLQPLKGSLDAFIESL